MAQTEHASCHIRIALIRLQSLVESEKKHNKGETDLKLT